MRKTILPVHAVTGLRAIGVINGKPVWPIMGGSSDEPPAVTPEAPPVPTAPAAKPDPETLGEPGKAALESERKARKEAEKAAKDFEAKLKAIEDKDKSELEKAQARIAELEKEHGTERAQRLRLQTATEHAIPAEYLDLLTATDEESLQAQAEKIAALVTANGVRPPVALPGQGQHQTTSPSGRERGLAEARKRFGDKKPA